jgi:rhodanese-related sulfurtransferase
MIKQMPSKKLKEYLKNNPNCVLLDVRTEEEWNIDGKPDGEQISLKTFFLTIQFSDKSFNSNFEDQFDKLNIEKDCEILTMCMAGVRSQVAAELISKKNYKCSNISDGFLGNNEEIGWKKNNLPCK